MQCGDRLHHPFLSVWPIRSCLRNKSSFLQVTPNGLFRFLWQQPKYRIPPGREYRQKINYKPTYISQIKFIKQPHTWKWICVRIRKLVLYVDSINRNINTYISYVSEFILSRELFYHWTAMIALQNQGNAGCSPVNPRHDILTCANNA